MTKVRKITMFMLKINRIRVCPAVAIKYMIVIFLTLVVNFPITFFSDSYLAQKCPTQHLEKENETRKKELLCTLKVIII